MTPNRWQEIDKLLEQALEREPGQRTAFLDKACAGDGELRREVESLLVAHEQAGSLLSAPVLQGASQKGAESLQGLVGQSLSHYQILSRLGEGGMGVVYKARDQHLDRFVAIKVLPPELMADPDRKRRFAQEARAASALNHPNIITIHDIASDNGTDFIVMEYVQGKTLGQVIPRRGLKLNDVLKYAIQISDALAKAHTAGIIHRDLKPGNIMVGEGGLVKVLDFGLAKLTERPQIGEEESTRSIPPWTDEGTILGTAAYMSPEQAAGKPVDARSDIFSFGSVLYEMVTGKRAFQGDSQMSILAAVLNGTRNPPVKSPERFRVIWRRSSAAA
jgi:serine/threonine protein kinase